MLSFRIGIINDMYKKKELKKYVYKLLNNRYR